MGFPLRITPPLIARGIFSIPEPPAPLMRFPDMIRTNFPALPVPRGESHVLVRTDFLAALNCAFLGGPVE